MKTLPTNSGLQGVNAAAITPRGKTGDINFGAIFELIDYLCSARVEGIALFTAWGEYPALKVDDRARLTHLAVKRSRVPVLAGVGSATLDHSLALSCSGIVQGQLPSGRPFGRSAIAASGSVAAVFKEASKRSPQVPGNPNINHD